MKYAMQNIHLTLSNFHDFYVVVNFADISPLVIAVTSKGNGNWKLELETGNYESSSRLLPFRLLTLYEFFSQ